MSWTLDFECQPKVQFELQTLLTGHWSLVSGSFHLIHRDCANLLSDIKLHSYLSSVYILPVIVENAFYLFYVFLSTFYPRLVITPVLTCPLADRPRSILWTWVRLPAWWYNGHCVLQTFYQPTSQLSITLLEQLVRLFPFSLVPLAQLLFLGFSSSTAFTG